MNKSCVCTRAPVPVPVPAGRRLRLAAAPAAMDRCNGFPGSMNISVTGLREAINCLDTKMASLMSQRHELESHLEQAVRSHSPILHLPSELLSSIFVAGVMDMTDNNPLMVPTLMLVCRQWADIVLETPVLWSKISVSPQDSLEKARRKLARSKSCPLDVAITFEPRSEYTISVMEQVNKAMELIRPALWRTRSFFLSVPNRSQANAVLQRCQENAPLLEVLSIRVFHSMQDDHYSTPPLPLFNGHTPRLHSCSFASFNFGWDTILLSRLRVLKLGGYFNGFSPSVKTLLIILRRCPDLEELALRNLSDVDSDLCHRPLIEQTDGYIVEEPFIMPRLTKVSFYYAGLAFTKQVMGQILFPNLEWIELCYLENVTPILNLLHTQSLDRLSLRYLRIESCIFNELKFLALLRRLPFLVTLELVDAEDASSSLLKGLSSLCPRLETLSLDGCTALDWDSLRTFVESRLPADSSTFPQDESSRSSRDRPKPAARSRRGRGSTCTSRSPESAVQLPRRLRAIDVTRCTQITREMVQWLRMFVPEVSCEPAKCVWGEPMLP